MNARTIQDVRRSNFEARRRRQKRIRRGVAAVWAFAILGGVCFWAAVFAVAIHFITKYW